MRIKIQSIIFLAILISFAGCKKDAVKKVMDDNKVKAESRSQISSRDAFASTLMAAIKNETALRTFIYNSIRKMDTSNYELVYLAEKDKVISNGNTFADIMNNYASNQVVNEFGNNYFSIITEDQPLLSISMSNFEGLKVSNWHLDTIPDVVALSTTDNSNFTKFSLYQSSPQEYTVTQNTDPSTIISRYALVVKKAEGYYLFDTNGQSIEGNDISAYLPKSGESSKDATDQQNLINRLNSTNFDQYSINGSTYYLMRHNSLLREFIDVVGPGGYYYPTTEWFENRGNVDTRVEHRSGCEEPCDRDCEDETEDEYLESFQLVNWDVFQSNRNQTWERKYIFHAKINLAIVGNDQLTPSTKTYVSPTFHGRGELMDCDNRPCSGQKKFANYRIWLDWDKTELASPFRVHWFEVDNHKTTVDFNTSLSAKYKLSDSGPEVSGGVSFGFTVEGSKTVDLGSQDVFYCDPIRYRNSTGSMYFYCR